MDANGTPLDVVGQTTVTLQLGNFKVDHQFIVVHNLTVDCLLGADFFTTTQHYSRLPQQHPICRTRLKSNHSNECDKKQFSTPLDNFCDTNSSVHAPCDMEIPGRTIQLIAGQLDNPWMVFQFCLLSQSPIFQFNYMLHTL